MKKYDVIIIGGGPAGMTASLNIIREGKTVLIIEKDCFGGQIALSPRVENIPSIKEISGEEYSGLMFEQIVSHGVEFELDEVVSIKKNDEILIYGKSNTYSCNVLVIATGSSPKHLGLKEEDKFIGKGISYCAICDGPFYKNEEVTLIGDGNTAMQYALSLSSYCKKVNICVLFDFLSADKALINKVMSDKNISINYNYEIKEIIGNKEVEKALFFDKENNKIVEINTKAIFVAIGQEPKNEIFKEYVVLKDGYIVCDENMATKTPNIFAIGDCRVKKYRQVITAQNDGAIAALNIVALLNKN